MLQDGKYRILRTLGQGGFGITYEAEQLSLGRKVAIKEFFMKEHCNRDAGTSHVSVPSTGSKELVGRFREKFIKEARMIAGFNHPNIVKIYDVFEEHGTAYYVMEYLEGKSLHTLVQEKGRLGEDAARGYTGELAQALGYIHGKGILHLDVKPSNVMLGNDGHAVLIDFGISKHIDSDGHLTSSTPLGMSRYYAPLEQIAQEDGSTYSAATDIYSLGATLYYLLTGRHPLESSALLKGLPTGDLEAAGVSGSTIGAIREAMRIAKEDRPQSVTEFMNLLSRTGDNDGGDETLTHGTLRILGRPYGAKVIIDGRQTGGAESPLEIKLEPGTHSVRIEKDGYAAIERSVTIKAGQTVEVRAELERIKPAFSWLGAAAGIAAAALVALLLILKPWERPNPDEGDIILSDTTLVAVDSTQAQPVAAISRLEMPLSPELPEIQEKKGSVKVSSSPNGAQIWLDGKDTGLETPEVLEDVDAGRHGITLKKEGYDNAGRSVSVQEGKRVSVDLALKEKAKEKGSVKINSTPKGAQIWIDGRNTGRSTDDLLEGLEVGSHSLRLVLDGYEPYTASLEISAGRQDRSYVLTEKPAPAKPVVQASSNRINGHEYVDLGLSVKWATCNVGASSPGDYGSYFAWGETSPKSSYDWENLKYMTSVDSYDNVKFSKYVASREYGTEDNRTRLELVDDAARANWGGSWRMPTRAEQDELREQCRWQWTTQNGHNGYKVTSKKNGNSIFLPAAGYCYGSSSYNVGSIGLYWSSSLSTSYSDYAYCLDFDSDLVDWYYNGRRTGRSVRPVSE